MTEDLHALPEESIGPREIREREIFGLVAIPDPVPVGKPGDVVAGEVSRRESALKEVGHRRRHLEVRLQGRGLGFAEVHDVATELEKILPILVIRNRSEWFKGSREIFGGLEAC